MKVLFLASAPETQEPIALATEIRGIQEKVKRTEIEIVSRWAVRAEDLLEILMSERPDIVHFSGHGEVGGIVLNDPVEGDQLVSGDALRMAFSLVRDSVRVVVLNACMSDQQAKAIGAVIDVVIGMQDSIDDVDAAHFARDLYVALGLGESVQNAFDAGRTGMALQGSTDIDVPTLIVRDGIDPAMLYLYGTKRSDTEARGRVHSQVEQERATEPELRKLLEGFERRSRLLERGAVQSVLGAVLTELWEPRTPTQEKCSGILVVLGVFEPVMLGGEIDGYRLTPRFKHAAREFRDEVQRRERELWLNAEGNEDNG